VTGPRDVEFRVLGPLEVCVGGQRVELAGPKQRALLGLLIAHRGEVVPTHHLLAEVWGGQTPGTGQKALQVQVSRLRGALDGVVLETRPTGYLLRVPPGALDLDTFHTLVTQARDALGRGRPGAAADGLRRALALWRGPAFADADTAELGAVSARLEEERRRALEDRVEADMTAGRYADVVPDLEQLVAADPLRERSQGQLMRALYATGRQADALAVFRTYRQELGRELGLEPGSELRDLEQAILQQDSTLPTQAQAPTRQGKVPGRVRRLARPAITVVAGLALAALALGTTVVYSRDRGPLDETRDTTTAGAEPLDTGVDHLVEIDPATNRVVSSTPVGADPESMAATPGVVWVANFGDRTVSRVEVATRVVRVVGGAPVAQHVTSTLDGDVWVSSFTEPVVTLLAENGRLAAGAEQAAPPAVRLPGSAEALAVGGGYLWVTSPADTGGKDQVFQIDLRTRKLVRAIDVGSLPLFVCVGYEAAWVANYKGDSVSVIRPGQQQPDTISVAPGPLGIAAGAGAVWVVSFWTHELTRIDPETLTVVGRLTVGGQPLGVAVGAGSVWVTSRSDRNVERIDPDRGTVVARVHLDSPPQGVLVAGDRVWVTTHSWHLP
jgi:DNA-binding SARP family transcriptional activator/streptogramin lyase